MNILAIFSWGGTTWTGDFKCWEVKTGFFRKRWMQTGSSGTLIGCKSGQNTFVPPWDRMGGAWLWTLYTVRRYTVETGKNQPMTFSFARRNFRAFLYICVRKQVKQPFLYLRLHPIPSKCPYLYKWKNSQGALSVRILNSQFQISDLSLNTGKNIRTSCA